GTASALRGGPSRARGSSGASSSGERRRLRERGGLTEFLSEGSSRGISCPRVSGTRAFTAARVTAGASDSAPLAIVIAVPYRGSPPQAHAVPTARSALPFFINQHVWRHAMRLPSLTLSLSLVLLA